MNEINGPFYEDRPGPAPGSSGIDWPGLARQRLARLVELEHDCAVMRDRLDQLRSDNDGLRTLNDDRLQYVRRLRIAGESARERIAELGDKCALMESSRSWRITAPLRYLAMRSAGGKHFVARILRAVVRRSRLGPFAARIAPTLHARARANLYSRRELH